jgi:tetratricopeptide (TPR) repeat protein
MPKEAAIIADIEAAAKEETSIEAEEKPSAALPNKELTRDVLYKLLMAEIAGQRGNTSLSLRNYRELATETRDPRIARRAAEVALFSRQNEAALEAARLWVEIDPDSAQARQMLAGILAGSDRLDEMEPHLAKLLRQEGTQHSDALLRLNRLFARNSDKRAVMELINRVTQSYLTIPEARFARAQAAQAAAVPDKAVEEADQALRLRPDWDQAVLLKAQVQHNDSPAKALDTLRRYLDRNPKRREVRLHYARALAGEKKYPESRVEFQRLVADFPGNPDVLMAVAVLSMQLNDPTMAEANFKKLVDTNQGDTNLARLYLGQIAEERKQYDKALEWYGSVGAGEQYIPAQIRYAQVTSRQGKVDDARRHLQELANSQSRDRIQLLLAEGQILRDAGRTREAYDLLEVNLSAQPNQPDLLYETALLAEKLGRIEVLETNLRKLISLKPDHAHAYNALGYSLADRNLKLEEAHTLITKALELAPEDPFIIDSMGWVLYRKGDLQGALSHLERAFKMRQDPEIAAHLGEVLWMLGRRSDATKTWREAAAAHPDNEVLAEVLKKFAP